MNRQKKWILGLGGTLLVLVLIGFFFVDATTSARRTIGSNVSIQPSESSSNIPAVSVSSIPSISSALQAQIKTAIHQTLQNKSSNSFDASGFVQDIYKQVGVQVPRTITEQIQLGTAITDIGSLQTGDLVVFDLGNVPNTGTFDGIYLGNGQFVARTSQNLSEISLNQPYWQQHFLYGRRILS